MNARLEPMEEIRTELRAISGEIKELASNQAAIQSSVQGLVDVARRHESDITKLWESRTQDRQTNWPMVTVIIALVGGAFGGLGALGKFAFDSFQRDIDKQEKYLDYERVRIDRIERERGAMPRFDELYKRGMTDSGDCK